MNLAGQLYREELRGESKKRLDYNFGSFLGHIGYILLRVLKPLRGYISKWEQLDLYHRTRKEMLLQLDVLFLLQRINFIENALSFLFSDS
jgi:hypothetical protein